MEDRCVYNSCCNGEYEPYKFVDDIIDDLKNNTSIHCVIKKLDKTVIVGKRYCHDIGEWNWVDDITY